MGACNDSVFLDSRNLKTNTYINNHLLRIGTVSRKGKIRIVVSQDGFLSFSVELRLQI